MATSAKNNYPAISGREKTKTLQFQGRKSLGKFGQIFLNQKSKMEKKRKYTEREAVRSRENRRKAKAHHKKVQALYDFVLRKYKFITDEFEEQYNATDDATDPIPIATVSPYTRFPEQSTETLHGMDLFDSLINLHEDLDLGNMGFNLFDDPYLSSVLSNKPEQHFNV